MEAAPVSSGVRRLRRGDEHDDCRSMELIPRKSPSHCMAAGEVCNGRCRRHDLELASREPLQQSIRVSEPTSGCVIESTAGDDKSSLSMLDRRYYAVTAGMVEEPQYSDGLLISCFESTW